MRGGGGGRYGVVTSAGVVRDGVQRNVEVACPPDPADAAGAAEAGEAGEAGGRPESSVYPSFALQVVTNNTVLELFVLFVFELVLLVSTTRLLLLLLLLLLPLLLPPPHGDCFCFCCGLGA